MDYEALRIVETDGGWVADAVRGWDEQCSLELAVYAPMEQAYWGGSGFRHPVTHDTGGSMEPLGAQLGFIAPRAGTYRIAARSASASSGGCPGYTLAFARGRPGLGPEPVH